MVDRLSKSKPKLAPDHQIPKFAGYRRPVSSLAADKLHDRQSRKLNDFYVKHFNDNSNVIDPKTHDFSKSVSTISSPKKPNTSIDKLSYSLNHLSSSFNPSSSLSF